MTDGAEVVALVLVDAGAFRLLPPPDPVVVEDLDRVLPGRRAPPPRRLRGRQGTAGRSLACSGRCRAADCGDQLDGGRNHAGMPELTFRCNCSEPGPSETVTIGVINPSGTYTDTLVYTAGGKTYRVLVPADGSRSVSVLSGPVTYHATVQRAGVTVATTPEGTWS